MDKQEARRILQEHAARYQARGYQSLQVLLADEDHYTVGGPSGTEYQLEAMAVWDDPRKKDVLRVMISIDDGGFLRACFPMTHDILVGPADQGSSRSAE